MPQEKEKEPRLNVRHREHSKEWLSVVRTKLKVGSEADAVMDLLEAAFKRPAAELRSWVYTDEAEELNQPTILDKIVSQNDQIIELLKKGEH